MERESSSRDDGGDADGGVNEQRGSYVWVARGRRSSGRLAMVQGLVEALDGQGTTATEDGRRGGAAEVEAAAAAAGQGETWVLARRVWRVAKGGIGNRGRGMSCP